MNSRKGKRNQVQMFTKEEWNKMYVKKNKRHQKSNTNTYSPKQEQPLHLP